MVCRFHSNQRSLLYYEAGARDAIDPHAGKIRFSSPHSCSTFFGMDAKREMLRHTLATLAYRGRKAVLGAPDSFPIFRAGETSRTPNEILAHIGDLLEWALSIAQGKQAWNNSRLSTWNEEVERFFRTLQNFETYLASDSPLATTPEKLFQGPIADALTHVGQITLLRRLASAPIRGENYFVADITPGRVGSDQPAPRREFD